MHNADLQTRLDIIHVLEETPDYKRLNQLVRDDNGLIQYGIVLRRAAVHLRSPVLVERLLNLPCLDKSSTAFQDAVLTAFTAYASGYRKTNSHITDLLESHLGQDKSRLTQSLSTLFGEAAEHDENYIKHDIAKLLIAAGADLEKAYDMQNPAGKQQTNRMDALKVKLG